MRKYIDLVGAFLNLIRPKQWLKNLLLFFPPFFAGKIADTAMQTNWIAAFASFSLMSSCCYIMNDIRDREADRNHPDKRNRAIASGKISVLQASFIAGILYLAALLVGSAVSEKFEALLIVYLAISFLYSFFLKQVVLVDIFVISFGFMIRVIAGGEAFRIPVSKWLFLTVFIVSLFLASGKRLSELIDLGIAAPNHRMSLINYSQSFLEGLLWFSAAASLVTYSLYTIDHQNNLFYTVPLATFGLIRYIYLARDGKGEPTELLTGDKQLLGVAILWVSITGIMIY
jgi:4-hydroxybenzoate polyprenyltransferase